jgi:hypothetical protein
MREKNNHPKTKGVIDRDLINLKNVDFCHNNFWEYCDNSGTKMFTRKCELICPNCGFFHSCSEP